MSIQRALCASMILLAAVGFGFPAQSDDAPPSTASGTFTVDGNTVSIEYAYVDDGPDDVIVMLSDNPVPRASVPFGGHRLSGTGEIHALAVTVDKKTRSLGSTYNALFHEVWGGQMSFMGEPELEITRLDDSRIEGSIATPGPVEFGESTFSYDIAFQAALNPPPAPAPAIEAVVTGADSAQGKIYAAYHQAIMGGDLEGLRSLLSDSRAEKLEGPDGQEMLEIAQLLRAPKIEIIALEEACDSTTLTVEGMIDGDMGTGTVSMVKVDGDWRIDKESWRFDQD